MGQSVSSWFFAEPHDVFDVMKYSEKMCSIVGINVYQFEGHPAKRIVKLSVVKVINFIVLNVLLMVIAVIHHSIPYDMVNNGSIIVTYGIRTLLVGGVLATSGEIVFLAWKWKSIVRLLQHIHELDLKLYFNVVYISIVIRFYCFVCILSRRFEHLNDVLKLRFDTSNSERDGRWLNETRYRNGPVQERIRVVQKLSDLHHQLNEITDHMNGVFGDVFLGNMLVVMLLCTFNIFALFKVYSSNDLRTRMFTVFNLSGSSYYTMMFMLISNLARTVSKESKHTGVLIHKAMNNETNSEIIRSLMVFSRQVRNRSAVVGSRQIVMDWPFIFQVRFNNR
uniref:Gustatory receptor n=1 Tax=Anopheles stephensi TaxID=30069 RepID=A0A182YNA4_ANOST